MDTQEILKRQETKHPTPSEFNFDLTAIKRFLELEKERLEHLGKKPNE